MVFNTEFLAWSIMNMNTGEVCQVSADLLITTFIPLPTGNDKLRV